MSQPPYSPDLAPSDFYLCPTMKEKLERTQVADEDKFFWIPASDFEGYRPGRIE
jgi:hypothetical protein